MPKKHKLNLKPKKVALGLMFGLMLVLWLGLELGLNLDLEIGVVMGLIMGLVLEPQYLLLLILPLALVLGLELGLKLGLIVQLETDLGIGLGLMLGLVVERLLQLFSSKKSSPLNRFDSFFPEEWRNDLETQIKRMIKAGKPKRFIKRKQIKVRLSWILSLVQIKLQNLWLPKNRRS